MAPDFNVTCYGTPEPAEAQRPFHLGPLSFLYTPEALRQISWNGTELVRAVAWPMRDENWGTYPPDILEERLDSNGTELNGRLAFTVADRRLDCVLKIHASASGTLHLDLTMTPTEGAFATNRAGFTVLHPIKGTAGAELQVTHSDGSVEHTAFPRMISPGQPVFDIQKLKYGLDGQTADIAFSGQIFEMEDQRNWSDASYKTYCVPLVFPFTYTIDRPETQSIRMSLSGDDTSNSRNRSGAGLNAQPTEAFAPAIGLAVEPGWLDAEDAIELGGPTHVLARIAPKVTKSDLQYLAQVTRGRELDIELVIPDADEPLEALKVVRDTLRASVVSPRRLIAVRESYLASHQPSGPWPDGPDPGDVISAARTACPDIAIGGGMLTNFTELNRCPPDPALCDFITHGSTAIVHAGDDLSVCETLETLPQIFESAQALAMGKPYRLGLVSIGMRSNPYGAAVADNKAQVRRTMARDDPRQRGLFAAAWAVGVLEATQGQHVEALCLAAPSGPFGIAYRPQTYPQAYFDDTPDATVYPLFHVVKAAASMAGERRLHVDGLPDGISAFGIVTETGTHLMIANITPQTRTVRLAHAGHVAVLDVSSFKNATSQTDWLKTAPRAERTEIDMGAFAIAFVEHTKTKK